MTTITTATAAARLGITPRHVRHLIKIGQLTATKQGRDWLIEESDLKLAEARRKPGRPRTGRTMKTEHDYGREYAEWLRAQNQAGADAVDIDEMIGGTVDIPPGDYSAMVADGIDNPDPRRYWEGFNSVFGG